MQLRDTVAVEGVKRTRDGYLAADVRVARTGIQIYSGREVGRPELDAVRVLRSEAEVFAADAMASFAHRPLTLDHPPEMVTAGNWRSYAVGATGGEVMREGECVRVPMLAMDAAAIDAIDAGKRELSVGYTCDLLWDAGTTEAGEAYDAVQTNIRANHLAVVTAARGGPQLRIGDGREDEGVVAADDDERHDDAADAAQVADADDSAALQAERLQREALSAAAAHGQALAAKDAEIATLKQQLADAAPFAARVRAAARRYVAVRETALRLAGETAVSDAADEFEIRRRTVRAKLGDAAKNWSDGEIEASFDTLAGAVAADSHDALRAALQDGVEPRDVATVSAKAHAEYAASLRDAWRRA